MKNQKSLLERIQEGESGNSFVPGEQDPAELTFDQQIRTLQVYIDALEREKCSIPRRLLAETPVC
jgi:hypothetical protein